MTQAPSSIQNLKSIFEQSTPSIPPKLQPVAPPPPIKKIDPNQLFKNNNDSPKNQPVKTAP